MNGLFETKQALMEFAIVCVSEYERRRHNKAQKAQKSKDLITQRAAYSEFGESWVREAVSKSLIHGKKMGQAKNSPVYFSRTEILSLIAAERLSELGVKIK
jgi:hypothetical protein